MDQYFYLKNVVSLYIIILLYVDILIIRSDMHKINMLKNSYPDSSNEGPRVAKYISGMIIAKDRVIDTFNLSQAKYINKLLK